MFQTGRPSNQHAVLSTNDIDMRDMFYGNLLQYGGETERFGFAYAYVVFWSVC